MNWKRILQHTAGIVGATVVLAVMLGQLLPDFGYQLYYPDYQRFPGRPIVGEKLNQLFVFSVIGVIAVNLGVMYFDAGRDRLGWAVHAFLVLLFCLLIGFPINLATLKLSFIDYSKLFFSFFVPALVFVIPVKYIYGFMLYVERGWWRRLTAPYEIDLSNLQPEQVIKAIGEPINVINLGTKTIYIYNRFKIIFSEGRVMDVQ